jgi:hypothetical protein
LGLGVDVVSQPHDRVAAEIEALNASAQAGIDAVGAKKQLFGGNYQVEGAAMH